MKNLSSLLFCSFFLIVSASAKDIVITYIDHPDRFKINNKIHAIFEKENPGIKLKHIPRPSGGADAYHDKLVTMLFKITNVLI